MLLIQRQYQGSVDQRNFDELEIDVKGRSGSIVIKANNKDGKKKEEGGGVGGWFSKMAEKMCGKKDEGPANDPHREASASLITSNSS